ncbi:tRNA-dihydrouridine synthase family protein [uncultured Muribaculum sp.]|uniref:tRNA-dihydrouridine synthase family protein n=1 Tax=uncultured Muribaculum sp. TaxID=1918613 RepID=UPI0025D1FFCE|nr:tRNA-dihydrouridine synthase family protein [uncultured Muribaculum sp.]
MNKEIYAAPLQGYTDGMWRRAHSKIYGGVTAYFTPFIRIEKDDVRPRDIRDLSAGTFGDVAVIPQIIFNSTDEFERLVDKLASLGKKRIDLNLGCPFPPQVKHGRGAGALRRELMEKVAELINGRYSELYFSVKMRPGISSCDEWLPLCDIINSMTLSHVTIHPRIAIRQYEGKADIDTFKRMNEHINHHIVYNGDLRATTDLHEISDRFDGTIGMMIGRGLLMRPSLAAEYIEGEEWSRSRRMEALCEFHSLIYDGYADRLCGNAQILSKIKPFWDYLEPEIGRKAWKSIHKATSLPSYLSFVEKALADSGNSAFDI